MQELEQKFNKIMEGIKASQEAHTALAATLDGLDNETLKKASKDAGDAAEALQALKQQVAAIEQKNEQLIKLATRPGAGKDGVDKEKELKARQELSLYLRKGAAVSADTIDYVVGTMVQKGIIGASDDQVDRVKKELSGSVDTEGGYFVRPELSDKVATRIFETSPMRLLADVQTTSSDVLEVIIDDNEASDGGWVGEKASRSTTNTPDVGIISIPVHEMYAQPKATQRILDDVGFDIESWLMGKVGNKMSRTENRAFVVGDGNGKPKGFLSYAGWATPGTYERNKLEDVTSGTSGDFGGDDLKKLKNSLIEDYQAGASWLMKRDTWEDVILLKDADGMYLLNRDSLRNGDDLTLLAKPVTFMHDMPDKAAGALPIAYGNWAMGYTIVDRMGMRVIRDVYTQKPYVLFYVTKRTGAAVTNFDVIKRLKIAA